MSKCNKCGHEIVQVILAKYCNCPISSEITGGGCVLALPDKDTQQFLLNDAGMDNIKEYMASVIHRGSPTSCSCNHCLKKNSSIICIAHCKDVVGRADRDWGEYYMCQPCIDNIRTNGNFDIYVRNIK